MRSRIAAALFAAALAAPLPAMAQAADPEGYADGYQNGDYGRVLYQEGSPILERAATDEGTSAQDRAARNTPVFPGDAIRTRGDERAEIELADGSRVRIDRDSSLLFQSLPDPRGKYKDNVVLVLRGGAIQISGRPSSEGDFRVDTESASVYLLGEAGIRVEAMPNRDTRVTSRRGVAEVVGQGGSVLVRGGMRTSVSPGATPETPRATSAFEGDAFDRWVALREDAERAPVAPRSGDGDGGVSAAELPEEVQPYYRELSSYGTWSNDADYGVVWSPYGVASDWHPYWDGGWTYGPYGYFWVSNEPWGWCPYHYGRWAWIGARGWR